MSQKLGVMQLVGEVHPMAGPLVSGWVARGGHTRWCLAGSQSYAAALLEPCSRPQAKSSRSPGLWERACSMRRPSRGHLGVVF